VGGRGGGYLSGRSKDAGGVIWNWGTPEMVQPTLPLSQPTFCHHPFLPTIQGRQPSFESYTL